MADRIVLSNMAFESRHGVLPREKVEAQRFEVDLELELDLGPAGESDDLTRTVDYGPVHELVRGVVEGPSVELLETLAERIAAAVLAAFPAVEAVTVRVRKPEVRLGGPLDYAGVEITRRRAG
ncbi:MAG TPA: dihydroneopterin aldolase [Candidatus Limnocylindrales bacterium]|nr:dihydroneopterin aldolase [Candidatus Limnocylindrales bacterium]